MKKIVYSLTLAIGCITLASCQKEDIGGTAAESLAGEWSVTADIVDNDYNVVATDPYGIGHFSILTYNTSANKASEIWVDDIENFWNFKIKVASNASNRTFGNSEMVDNTKYDCGVLIERGKVLEKAATNPHGTKSDSIVFYVSFDDDPAPGTKYKIAGYRYTGLTSDE